MANHPIPQGFHTITPYLTIRDATHAIDFYKQAFGATELLRVNRPDGTIMHAEIKIGDSPVMLTDENPLSPSSPQSLGACPVGLFLYVADVDAFAQCAVAAGAKMIGTIEDFPNEGDRRGGLEDPFGYTWWIASHYLDISRQQMQQHFRAANSKQGES